jgi:putative redox protein
MSGIIKTNWKEKMSFEWDVNGHKVTIDADERVGGENKGFIELGL